MYYSLPADAWLQLIFKLMIFDHAAIIIFLTIAFIRWIAPKWWSDRKR